MEAVIDPIQKELLQREFITALKDAGLVLLPKAAAEYGTDFLVKQKIALSKTAITPYKIAKLKLIPGVKTLKTVKDMINDGRIGVNEFYTDSSGKTYVLTAAVKRLRND